MTMYWQKCPKCANISTPDCEGHICHKCRQAKYEQYEEYKTVLKSLDLELVKSDSLLDWTEEQRNLLHYVFSAIKHIMIQLETTQSIREWNALDNVRERLNHIMVSMIIKDGQDGKG